MSNGEAYEELQKRLVPLFRDVFPDPLRPRTVIVLPSLTFHPDFLCNVESIRHYEERMLCMLMLLRLPHTRVIYLTSVAVDPSIVDYYLHLLPGIPSRHARRRLTLLACHDNSLLPLTRKILDRPRLVRRIREAIGDVRSAHLSCYTVTREERELALRLDVPVYGCDPEAADAGTKSGGREVFKAAGVPVPDGFERLSGEADVVAALAELKHRHGDLRTAVIKLELGTSGEGNATFSYEGCPAGGGLGKWVAAELPRRIRFEIPGDTWADFRERLADIGAVVECWVEGEEKRSPSVQCRVDPLGHVELVSTHDQVLGGVLGQAFEGCSFPAAEEYRREIQEVGLRVAEVLRQRSILGRFSVDFVSVLEKGVWRHYGLEINLRKGGTTHPYLTLQLLTDGTYDPETGLYRTATGQRRFYYASDTLKDPAYKGMTPDDLIDVAVEHGLHFDSATQQGVVFHLIGALSEFGQLGLMCIADSPENAFRLYRETVEVLDREARREI